MPQGFRFLDETPDLDPAAALRSAAACTLGGFNYQGLARLKPGVTVQQANADIARMLPIWLKAWPSSPGLDRTSSSRTRGITPALRPLKQDVVGDVGDMLWVLMGTIGIVLLIACANVANLVLVRAEGRQQELAVRAALGAGRGRLARELLLESLVLGAAGGALGLALAYAAPAAARRARRRRPAAPRRDHARSRRCWRSRWSSSLVSSLLFGVIPVVKHAGPQRSRRAARRRRATRATAGSGTARATRWSWCRSRSRWCCWSAPG